MSKSWALYIDEEGFGQHWDDTMEAFRGLNALMEAICRIGMRVYPGERKRLFCYQFGDGFLITSEFNEEDLTRSVLIAIAILRHALAADRVAKACLAEGNISSIAGCYPKEVRDAPDRSCVRLGEGLLITTPVLGEGLLNTVRMGKKKPKGPLLLVDAKLQSRFPRDISFANYNDDVIVLNWLKGEPNGLQALQKSAELAIEPEEVRVSRITQYIKSNITVRDEWKAGVYNYLLQSNVPL